MASKKKGRVRTRAIHPSDVFFVGLGHGHLERFETVCLLKKRGHVRRTRRVGGTSLCFLGFWYGEGLDEEFDLFCFDDQVLHELPLVCWHRIA